VAKGPREGVEANLGASSETNFYVGFSGEISEGGVFVATYTTLEVGALATVHITLPGGFEFKVPGRVQFVRDPMDMSEDAEPGMGVKFEALAADQRELILRFVRKRAPMFYDDCAACGGNLREVAMRSASAGCRACAWLRRSGR
jgi:uncharacterized protein (TIGR02266 family)